MIRAIRLTSAPARAAALRRLAAPPAASTARWTSSTPAAEPPAAPESGKPTTRSIAFPPKPARSAAALLPNTEPALVADFHLRASTSPDFRLTETFLAKYRDVAPPFGFNGLGELVYLRTYSRLTPDGGNETWHETVARVVNGTFNLQKRWIEAHHLGWDARKAQATAQKMYDRIFKMKFLPPGRGLWAMGSPITEKRGLFAALNNCAFVSTADMWDAGNAMSDPLTFLMDASMLGVGVGFDTKGANGSKKSVVHGPSTAKPPATFAIPDSREGWVASLGFLIESYFDGGRRAPIVFDYTKIRPAGTPIKGFGGVASGPDVLRDLHVAVRGVLDANRGAPLSSTTIVDIMNLIGKCVVAGNVRRTAEIAFGDADDASFVDLKDYAKNPHRAAYGWTSNNSVFCTVGHTDYAPLAARVRVNGEPGFFWLDNARAYGRMADAPDHRDAKASGGNPCLEQTLESYELCCLVETFPHNHADYADFAETLRLAHLYAKTVTLARTHWPRSNRVMLRNRRIGCSISGVAQFVAARGIDTLRDWCDRGYKEVAAADAAVSDWLAIPRSIKTTTVKPSGTVSLLAGATPGMHFPESRYCLRRVRLARTSPLVAALRDAGYHVEPAVGSEDSTVVATFPIDFGGDVRPLSEVSMWEQLALAAFLQRHWSDNQVSCTVTFDPATEGPHLHRALDFYQYQLKGVSFLPRVEAGAYAQMPYEAIDEETYARMVAQLGGNAALSRAVSRAAGGTDPEMERYCDNNVCSI
ncbi:hypothetical protein H9P43_000215 [Blastocladiella emersonii ATCC 22665]|nr:hypothetical protein H9P43_000215 [Blastocladiella emersonii ATCC 22665]